MNKKKKQFRLYDIYRCAATGYTDEIAGIESYEVNKDATTINIIFKHESVNKRYLCSFCSNEDERKDLIKSINKKLGNCQKPGKKGGK